MELSPHGSSFSGRVGWGERPALLIIDLCRAYTEPDGPFALPEADAAVAATVSLVDAARAGGRPVVWTQVRYARDLIDGGLFARKVPALSVFADGAEGRWGALTLTPELDDLVLSKQYASAFFATSLAATLHGRGVDTVVVAGVSTSGCVRASATDAIGHGFRPQVVEQGCADRTRALHEQNLADLDAKYADVTTLDEALGRLTGRVRDV